MSRAADSSPSSCFTILAFNARNQLAVRETGVNRELAYVDSTLSGAISRLEVSFGRHTPPVECFTSEANGNQVRTYLTQVAERPAEAGIAFHPIEVLAARPEMLDPALAALLGNLEPHLAEIPYLHLSESDFIYKFRPALERNSAIYDQDSDSNRLYQSKLCAAIKTLARQLERTAAPPVTLDFGAVQYIVPSHFGFCLGVKNAIERAYETLAENPNRRVFMLSELIHNPFVNEDLVRRGLRYLQTDKGIPYTVDGQIASEVAGHEAGISDHAAPGQLLRWDTLTPEDIVIIPAFGATDDDKRRLVRKGIPVFRYDATCMLVEKVWKAARAYGREGYTVVIHGKHEHEETKATFLNTLRFAPAVIVRNLEEARQLGEIISGDSGNRAARFAECFGGRHTPGFDVSRHLERVAVVNQTTLLMNETIAIIEHLRSVYRAKYGDEARVGGSGRRDTLCYATQVNQDALSRALAEPLDAAFVIGGKNSSNTYQLFRLCEQRLEARAFFIQSESSIRSFAEVDHHLYGGNSDGYTERRPLWPHSDRKSGLTWSHGGIPKRVLVTGGASCPDGVIQQVITRINSFFPPDALRSVDEVLGELEAAERQPPRT